MKNKKLLEKTTNSGEFNKRYKLYLEDTGKIRCARCKYHKNENNTNKYYGGYGLIKHPNWKLISKNKKQWMKTNNKKLKTSFITILQKNYFEFVI